MKNNTGQAMVTLLFYMIIAITITSAAVVVIFSNSLATSKLEIGSIAYSIAESGAENALIRLLKDQTYTGETLNLGDGTAQITVTGSNPKVINSQGKLGNFNRTIEVTATFLNNILNVTSWKEI
jgi:hypothetical protein